MRRAEVRRAGTPRWGAARDVAPGASHGVARRGAFGAVGSAVVRVGLAVGAGGAGLGALLGAPAGVARAFDEWCDTDPLAADVTAEGRPVVVFYLVGVRIRNERLAEVRALLLTARASLTARCNARTVPGGTEVEVTVTVPPDVAGGPYETRLQVCSVPQCLAGQSYATASGRSGSPMTARFLLPAA